jgi:predicted phage terminase large subunit-like protein
MQNNMTEAEYAQEMECDFNANVLVGSVYGDFMRRFTEKNIDDSHCWDPSLPVWTAWDLGISDYTCIWFFQVKNNVVTFIDYLEDNGKEIGWYASEVLRKEYYYQPALLPHDGGHRSLRGAPIFEQLNKFGIRTEVLGLNTEYFGISEARTLLKTCRFHRTNCKLGLQRLKNFKYKVDKKTGLKQQHTEHDENSHGADAFRYAALGRPIWEKVSMANQWNFYQERTDIYKDVKVHFLTMDTAFKTGDTSNECVLQWWGVSPDRMHLLDMEHGQWDFNDLIEKTKLFYAKSNVYINNKKPIAIYVEDASPGTSFVQFLRNARLPVSVWFPQAGEPKDKVSRVHRALILLEKGKIYLPENSSASKQLVVQCAIFPNGNHNYIIDAFAMAVLIARRIYPAFI